jgi:hypothetical protein
MSVSVGSGSGSFNLWAPLESALEPCHGVRSLSVLSGQHHNMMSYLCSRLAYPLPACINQWLLPRRETPDRGLGLGFGKPQPGYHTSGPDQNTGNWPRVSPCPREYPRVSPTCRPFRVSPQTRPLVISPLFWPPRLPYCTCMTMTPSPTACCGRRPGDEYGAHFSIPPC